jgi:hypothetical protein
VPIHILPRELPLSPPKETETGISDSGSLYKSGMFPTGHLPRRPRQHLGTTDEPRRPVPVLRDCDVLVVGGGPSGTAAAINAARMSVDVVLLERASHLGGLSTGGLVVWTGGLVVWIDRMTDWAGRQVIQGIANDLLDRLPQEAVTGPPRSMWGSRDDATAARGAARSRPLRGLAIPGIRSLPSESTMPAIRRCSEGASGFPKPFVLGNPGARLGLGGKAGGCLRQSAGPGHLHGNAVIGSLDHVIICIWHRCPPRVGSGGAGLSTAQRAFRVHTKSSLWSLKITFPARTVPTMSA